MLGLIRVSTTNYFWPSKLSYYCFPTQRKQGLLCYCWIREKEWESWNKAACVHVLVRERLTYYVCPHSRVSPVCVGFCGVWFIPVHRFDCVYGILSAACHSWVYWSARCVLKPGGSHRHECTWVRAEERLKRLSAHRNVELCRKTPGSRGRTNKARGGKRKKRLRRGRMTREIKQSEWERQNSCCLSHMESRKKAGKENSGFKVSVASLWLSRISGFHKCSWILLYCSPFPIRECVRKYLWERLCANLRN